MENAVDSPSPVFERNLLALSLVNADLAGRLRLPVDSSHLEEAPGEVARHCYRRLKKPLVDSPAPPLPLPGPGGTGDLAVLGVGTGDTVTTALAAYPLGRIFAWERDPALLQLVLRRHDWASVLLAGRLRLFLGPDLAALAAQLPLGAPRLTHALLGPIYADEIALLQGGLFDSVALLCEGELFVDDLSEALREEGYGVYRLEAARLATEEIGHTLGRLKPRFVVSINWIHGLADLCERAGVDYRCWEIDPALDELSPPVTAARHTRVFTYYRDHVAGFRAAGYPQAEYLPLAANASRRRPERRWPSSDAPPSGGLSFVGASMVREAWETRRRFVAAYAVFRGSAEGADEAEQGFNALIKEQLRTLFEYRVPTLANAHFGAFLHAARREPAVRQALSNERGACADPVQLIAESAASLKRYSLVSALGPLGVEVWGDEGWKGVSASGAVWRGPADHYHELNAIFSLSRVNVDIGRIYQQDMVTMRVFDVLACGGFVITEACPALAELFTAGVELETYQSLVELVEKSRFYLRRPDAARRIARRGREKVCRCHTIRERLKTLTAD